MTRTPAANASSGPDAKPGDASSAAAAAHTGYHMSTTNKMWRHIKNEVQVTVQLPKPRGSGGVAKHYKGTLLAFDRHMNLILDKCSETRVVPPGVTENPGSESQSVSRDVGLVFLRGSHVIGVSRAAKTRRPRDDAPVVGEDPSAGSSREPNRPSVKRESGAVAAPGDAAPPLKRQRIYEQLPPPKLPPAVKVEGDVKMVAPPAPQETPARAAPPLGARVIGKVSSRISAWGATERSLTTKRGRGAAAAVSAASQPAARAPAAAAAAPVRMAPRAVLMPRVATSKKVVAVPLSGLDQGSSASATDKGGTG